MLTSLYVSLSRGLQYNSLYALNLHSTFASHQVPFSSDVSQNKRTSTSQSNELKLSLHITQTETYLYLKLIYLHVSDIYIKFHLSESCVDWPSICV